MSEETQIALMAILTVVAIPIVGALTKDLGAVTFVAAAGIIIVLLIGVLS